MTSEIHISGYIDSFLFGSGFVEILSYKLWDNLHQTCTQGDKKIYYSR